MRYILYNTKRAARKDAAQLRDRVHRKSKTMQRIVPYNRKKCKRAKPDRVLVRDINISTISNKHAGGRHGAEGGYDAGQYTGLYNRLVVGAEQSKQRGARWAIPSI